MQNDALFFSYSQRQPCEPQNIHNAAPQNAQGLLIFHVGPGIEKHLTAFPQNTR